MWSATAPANIALIKYMGKTDTQSNLPCNPSLSYTLDNLITRVDLEISDSKIDQWQSLQHPGFQQLHLSAASQQRFLQHLMRLKQHFNYSGNFIVRSANNFPADCGLASSASSFAALTRCACKALTELTTSPSKSIIEMAELSRQASGSSCRSFFSPWSLWQSDTVQAIDLPYKNLIHQVIIVANATKHVSSSKAHQQVLSSQLFINRPQRAEQRLTQLCSAMEKQQWRLMFEIIWQEFSDMHALFSTSSPPFSYITADSITVLNNIEQIWQQFNDGPLATMDAGPNIHLLFRADQNAIKIELTKRLQGKFYVL